MASAHLLMDFPPRGWFWWFYAHLYDAIWDSPLTQVMNDRIFSVCGSTGVGIDLGCGTGLSSASLTRRGWIMIGVDSSRVMALRALTSRRVAKVIEADASAVQIADNSFDLVVVSNILHLHKDPFGVLNEANRLVTPQALIACVWPVDSLSLWTIFHYERRSKRSLAQSWKALILRAIIGIAGVSVSARLRSSTAVKGLLLEWMDSHPIDIVDYGCTGIEEFVIVRNVSKGGLGQHRD